MAYKIPVGGVFCSVYYDYEPAFRIYGDAYINPNYYQNITKVLGQGIKITAWNVNNNVNVIAGINSIEATSSVDGPVAGTLTFDIEATGDIDFIQSIMGNVSSPLNGIVTYTAGLVPKSMVFVIYIPNDQDDPTGGTGDCYVLKGVVPKTAAFSIEQGNNPLHIKFDCAYATEIPYGIQDIPPQEPNYEDVFNFSEAIAYFYNPGSDLSNPSFNSFETIIQKLNFTIDHGGDLIPALTTRLAQERWYKNLMYTPVELTAVYREKERFIIPAYGDKYGPLSSGVVRPYVRMLLVLQNNKFCSNDFRRLEFEFNFVKIDSLQRDVSSDSVITEQLGFKPLNCIIRQYKNVPPTPEFTVSPYHVIQGDLVTYRGSMFTPGELLRVYIDGPDGAVLRTTIQINLSGGAEYRTIATGSNGWTIGEHTVTAMSTGSGFTTAAPVKAYATGTNGVIPKIVLCPDYASYSSGSTYTFTVNGYGFDTSNTDVSGTGKISLLTNNGRISPTYATVTGSSFNQVVTLTTATTLLQPIGYSGPVIITASETSQFLGTVTIKATDTLNITNVLNTGTGIFQATGLVPSKKAGVYVETGSTSTARNTYTVGSVIVPPYGAYIGAAFTDTTGKGTLTNITNYRLGSVTYYLGAGACYGNTISSGTATYATGTITFMQNLVEGVLTATAHFDGNIK